MIKNRLFNSEPLLVHAPGKRQFNPCWDEIHASLFSRKVPAPAAPANLSIITWNSGMPNAVMQPHKQLGTFEKSLDHFNLRCAVLGKDSRPFNNRMKLQLSYDYLATAGGDFVLGADSADALLVSDPADILQRFAEYDCDLLFNAERHFSPVDPSYTELREFEESIAGNRVFPYLNGGLWLGRKSFCLDFFEFCLEVSNRTPDNCWSEQACLKQAYKQFFPRVRIDSGCLIFQNLNRVGRDMLVVGGKNPTPLQLCAGLMRELGSPFSWRRAAGLKSAGLH